MYPVRSEHNEKQVWETETNQSLSPESGQHDKVGSSRIAA